MRGSVGLFLLFGLFLTACSKDAPPEAQDSQTQIGADKAPTLGANPPQTANPVRAPNATTKTTLPPPFGAIGTAGPTATATTTATAPQPAAAPSTQATSKPTATATAAPTTTGTVTGRGVPPPPGGRPKPGTK